MNISNLDILAYRAKKVSFFFFKNKTNEQLQKWVLMKGGG